MPVDPHAVQAMQVAQERVPKVIRALMAYHKVSQEQLAAGLGMKQEAISRRLRLGGHLRQEEVAGIAAFFSVPVWVFYEGAEEAIARSRCSDPLAPLRILQPAPGQLSFPRLDPPPDLAVLNGQPA